MVGDSHEKRLAIFFRKGARRLERLVVRQRLPECSRHVVRMGGMVNAAPFDNEEKSLVAAPQNIDSFPRHADKVRNIRRIVFCYVYFVGHMTLGKQPQYRTALYVFERLHITDHLVSHGGCFL